MIVEEENWQKDKQKEYNSYYNKVQVNNMENMKGVNIQRDKYDSEKIGLSIEIQIDPECDLSTCTGTIMHITEILIIQQTKNKVISRVYDINSGLINEKNNKLDNWAMELRIIIKNKYVSVETILEVYTNVSACALYKHKKEYCDSNNVNVGYENTIIEYTKKWDF